MKKRNRFLALMLATVLSFSAAACGSQDSNSGAAADEKSPSEEGGDDAADKQEVDALAAAKDAVKEIKSLNAQMVVEMDMEVSAEGQTQAMQTVTTMDMTCLYDPMRIKAESTVDAGELGSTSTTVYAETGEDGKCTMYLNDGTSWQTQEIQAEALEQYDAVSNIMPYLEDGYEFEAAGNEQVNGKDAYKYTGVIKGENMKEALNASGALDSLSSLGMTAEQAEEMLDELGEMEINLWIDAESYYPLKYEMDMAEVMNSLMAKVMESADAASEDMSMSFPKANVSMTCSDINEAEEFTIPDEAKAE